MTIENSTPDDIDKIFSLYETARSIQKEKGATLWPHFDEELIQTEISEKRQWKVVIDNQIACVWATTFDDPQIWGDANEDPALYIHRIATNLAFRGQNMVSEIVKWATENAAFHQKRFIRMDTVGENKGLIDYYQKSGFEFLGLHKLTNTDGLPAHYYNATVSLFQITL
jgi:ribosomal protein S18 acetylase RimI-like enzyme